MTTCLVQIAIALLLLSGLASLAISISILAVAVLLATSGFEWDGPILWDRVMVVTLSPALLGVLLLVSGFALKREVSK